MPPPQNEINERNSRTYVSWLPPPRTKRHCYEQQSPFRWKLPVCNPMLLSLRREHAATVLLLDNGSCLCNVCAHCVECVWQTVNFELRAICFYLKWFWMVCHTLRAAGTGCSVGSLANLGSLQRKRVWLARQEVIVTTNYSAELVMASMLVWSLSIIRTWNARHATVVLINGFLALVLVRWSSNRTKVYWCVGFKNHGFCTFIPQYSRVTALYISLSAHRNKPKKSSYERIWDNVFSYDCGAPWRYSKSIRIRFDRRFYPV